MQVFTVRSATGSFVGSSGQAARKGQQPRDFVLMEGEGWKMGYDRNPINTTAYTALIGSDTWSVSLTRDEFTDFLQVRKSHVRVVRLPCLPSYSI